MSRKGIRAAIDISPEAVRTGQLSPPAPQDTSPAPVPRTTEIGPAKAKPAENRKIPGKKGSDLSSDQSLKGVRIRLYHTSVFDKWLKKAAETYPQAPDILIKGVLSAALSEQEDRSRINAAFLKLAASMGESSSYTLQTVQLPVGLISAVRQKVDPMEILTQSESIGRYITALTEQFIMTKYGIDN